MDLEKMKQAFALAKQIDDLLSDAGVYATNINTGGSFKDFYEDLDIDITRVESGDVE